MVVWSPERVDKNAKGAAGIQLVREEEEFEQEEIQLLIKAQNDFAEALKTHTESESSGKIFIKGGGHRNNLFKNLSKLSTNVRNLITFHKKISKIANDICDAITEARKDTPEGYSKFSADEYRVLNQLLVSKDWIVKLAVDIDTFIDLCRDRKDIGIEDLGKQRYLQSNIIFSGFAHLISTLKELYSLQEEVYKLFEILYAAKK